MYALLNEMDYSLTDKNYIRSLICFFFLDPRSLICYYRLFYDVL